MNSCPTSPVREFLRNGFTADPWASTPSLSRACPLTFSPAAPFATQLLRFSLSLSAPAVLRRVASPPPFWTSPWQVFGTPLRSLSRGSVSRTPHSRWKRATCWGSSKYCMRRTNPAFNPPAMSNDKLRKLNPPGKTGRSLSYWEWTVLWVIKPFPPLLCL